MAMETAAAEIATEAVRAQLFSVQPGSLAARVAEARARQRQAAEGDGQPDATRDGQDSAAVTTPTSAPSAQEISLPPTHAPAEQADEDDPTSADFAVLRGRFARTGDALDGAALDSTTDDEDVWPGADDEEAWTDAEDTPLVEALSAAQAEIERLQAQLQCAQDDGLALRRRSEREKAEFQQAARGDAIVPLLPVIDDFERALTNVPDALRDDPWASGIAIIAEGMRLALQRQGVERIAADGVPFDPHYHEAVAQVENPDVPAEMVTRVYRAGYALGGRVLRPAQVQVALGPSLSPAHAPAAAADVAEAPAPERAAEEEQAE